jgi:hypothetical protein
MSLIYGDDFKGQTNMSGNFLQPFVESKIVSAKNLILPATTLDNYCYNGMFFNCTSLTETPDLIATTLASGCYYQMFFGCTSLTTAPELPATTLASYCYNNMFNGCSNLNRITMLATDISASDCLYKWVSGVASNGTFIKNAAMTSLPKGSYGIPTGWTVENYNA